MSNKKTFAEEMYEQENKDIDRAVNTLNKIVQAHHAGGENYQGQNASKEIDTMREEYDFSKLGGRKNPYIHDEKLAVMCYLTKLYIKATKENKTEMAARLTRAMIAFDYNDMGEPADWEKMCETYFGKE